MYIDDLLGPHCGDCTCVPCTCTKCWAESFFSLDTIKGLGKHEASKIWHCFEEYDKKGKKWKQVRTINEVIETLRNYKVSEKDHRKLGEHAVRWEREAINAVAWLEEYRDTHFPGCQPVDPNGNPRENASA